MSSALIHFSLQKVAQAVSLPPIFLRFAAQKKLEARCLRWKERASKSSALCSCLYTTAPPALLAMLKLKKKLKKRAPRVVCVEVVSKSQLIIF